MSEPVIFLGPSLSLRAARERLAAEYRPPIRRGDLEELLKGPLRPVGIVDGVFFQRLAISPKEILRLLEAGFPIWGASSMGALRAVELEPYGMVGVGRIFDAYRSGLVDADDEVALTYDPETLQAASEALVNFRFALDDAVTAQLLTPRERVRILVSLKRLHFPERTLERLLQMADRILPRERKRVLEEWMRDESANWKRRDALELLRQMGGARGTVDGTKGS